MKLKVSIKVKAIETKRKIAKLLEEVESMEKRRIVEIETEKLHIQEQVVKSQAKLKIYENLEQMSQQGGKIEVQEGKGIGQNHLRYAQVVADKKTGFYNKNQEVTVSFLHQRNGEALDDKNNDNDLKKPTNDGFDARCMKIKSKSRYFGNPTHICRSKTN